ncbi:NADPH:quinone oxidoreductase family protein [Hyphomicrobiales bacterium]|nr:NADPH:quinone oxidoreductase family protein [Hyphomicrobiales bacterium]
MFRSVVVNSLSDDFSKISIEELDRQNLNSNEVRVKVYSASVNFPDLLMTKGLYQYKPEVPFTLGMESSGVIIETGKDVKDFNIGDEVIVSAFTGSFSEETVIVEGKVRKKPLGLTWEQASTYTVAYLTAYVSLITKGGLKSGETLLVHGAAGGVGLAAVDIGRFIGAKVIAVASTQEKRDFLLSYGADFVLSPDKGFKDHVKEITNNIGADVVYDPVGGDVFDESIRCIAWNGRLLVVGFASGRIPSIPANMPLIKGFSVIGVRAGEYGRRSPQEGKEHFSSIDKLISGGSLNPHIHKIYSLNQAVDALKELRDRKVIGKVCVNP